MAGGANFRRGGPGGPDRLLRQGMAALRVGRFQQTARDRHLGEDQRDASYRTKGASRDAPSTAGNRRE